MRGLTTAQMRQNIGRLVAAGLAVMIATAFVAATLLASGVIQRTTYDAIGASFARADLVVSGETLTDDVAAAIDTVEGVTATHAVFAGSMLIQSGAGYTYVPILPAASDPGLEAQELVEGTAPGTGEIALPVAVAERLNLEVGDRFTATFDLWRLGPPVDGQDGTETLVARTTEVLVSGIVRDTRGAYLVTDGAALVAAADAQAWVDGRALWHDHVLVAVAPGTSVEATRSSIADTLDLSADRLVVRTRDEQTERMLAEQVGATNMMTAVVLGFAAVAMVVAAFVIANTFAVLVAQRTRTLALLRVVGATRRQLRRTVTTEAALLGLSASIVGVLLGSTLTQLTLTIVRERVTGVPLPATITPTVASMALPVLLGTVVTLLAALAPARAAGRVAPIAALRPADAPSVGAPGSRARLIGATILTISGTGLLAVAVAASAVSPLIAVLIGVVGGAISFSGVLLGAVFWIPRVLGAAGATLARFGGPTTALAAANAVRNPRRTAATSSALLIGVTLVVMMSTGAASARHSFTAELDSAYPVDIEVRSSTAAEVASEDGGQITRPPAGPDLAAALRSVDGVAAVAAVTTIDVVMPQDDGTYHLEVHSIAPEEVGAVVRDPSLVEGLADDTIVLPAMLATAFDIESGDKRTIGLPDADGEPLADGPTVDVTLLVRDLPGWTALATPDLAAALAPDATATGTWVRLEDPGDAASVTSSVRDLLSDQPVQIVGAAVERASFDQVIDTALAVVVGLLAVAVIIALVGVTNTLSLAVIERRRESATLRAVGLTKRGLRRSLAIEGALITMGGAALGAVLGTLYGWAGSQTLLGAITGSSGLVVAWRDIAIVIVVALVAGLLASVLPARSAARTSPVAALGAE